MAEFPLPPPTRKRWSDPTARHLAAFLATCLSTTYFGAWHWASFVAGTSGAAPIGSALAFWVGGLWFSLTVIAILGAHELGHYVACRYYDVDASLPWFLPAPLPLTGTLGAFIRIREPIPNKRALFDIAVAGPFAGFLVALPLLAVGVALSRPMPLTTFGDGYQLGDPLVFQAFEWLVWGPLPDTETLSIHPMGLAAWFGLLATALNLFPLGQLDGGHVAYAVFGSRARWITLGTAAASIALAVASISWLAWAALVVGMTALTGPGHPPTLDDALPLDRPRRVLAALAAVVFLLCFTPVPIEPLDAGSRPPDQRRSDSTSLPVE